ISSCIPEQPPLTTCTRSPLPEPLARPDSKFCRWRTAFSVTLTMPMQNTAPANSSQKDCATLFAKLQRSQSASGESTFPELVRLPFSFAIGQLELKVKKYNEPDPIAAGNCRQPGGGRRSRGTPRFGGKRTGRKQHRCRRPQNRYPCAPRRNFPHPRDGRRLWHGPRRRAAVTGETCHEQN